MPRRPALVAVPVLAVVTALTVTACGSSGGSSASSETVADSPVVATSPTTSSPAESTPTVTPTSGGGQGSQSGPATGSTKPVTVGKSFVDPLLGDKGTVLTYVANYPASAAAKQKYSTIADGKVVLVQVKVTAGTKYYGSVGEDSFLLLGQSGTQPSSPTTSIIADELAKAGYPPLKDAETGKSSTGWMAFVVDTTFTPATLRYERGAARGSDGKTIPAKNFDIALG